jgi:hypothetical protein
MAPPEFSEFSYGYALTEKLIQYLKSNQMPIRLAPIFPSLIEEGKINFGYDIKLDAGVPLFLQFKRSHYMQSGNSIGYQQFYAPFYRIRLMPRSSNQHESLLALEAQGNEVDYVAPVFYKIEELNEKYCNSTIVQDSIFIRPSAIDHLPDDDQHYVGFQYGNQLTAYRLPANQLITSMIDSGTFLNRVLTYRLSKAKLIEEDIRFEVFLKRILHRVESEESIPHKTDFLNQILQGMIDIIKKYLLIDEQNNEAFYVLTSELRPLELIAYLSAVYFECAFYLIGRV